MDSAHADPARGARQRGGRAGGQRGAARAGPLGARDPAADGAGRHARACASRSRRRTATPTWTGCSRHSPALRRRRGAPSRDAARRDPRRRARTSCCCTAGRCTAACGARGSTSSRGTRACTCSTCPATAAAQWPARYRDLAGLARAVLPQRAARRGAARLVARRHARARARAAASAAPARAGARRDHAEVPRRARTGNTACGPRCWTRSRSGLAGDYRRTVQNFLALQTRGDERARETLRLLRGRLASHGEPDRRALAAGPRHPARRRPARGPAAHRAAGAGDRGRARPADAARPAGRELAARLPAARFQLIERSGHAPFLSHPDRGAGRGARLPGPASARGGGVSDPFRIDGGRGAPLLRPRGAAATTRQPCCRRGCATSCSSRLDVVRLEPTRRARPRRRHRPRVAGPQAPLSQRARSSRSTSPRACCARPGGARPCCGGSGASAATPRPCRCATAAWTSCSAT